MDKIINEWMKLYETNPSLKLYDVILDTSEETTKIINKISINSVPNPIDVVFESLINVISEDYSSKNLTDSKNKVLINKEIIENASLELIKYLENSSYDEIKEIHDVWLNNVYNYIIELFNNIGNLQMDELLYRVGERYRISSKSAIKALNSL